MPLPTDADLKNFRPQVNARRLAAGLSYRRLAFLTGRTVQSVKSLMTTTDDPRLSTVLAFAKVYNCEPYDLLRPVGDDARPAEPASV